MLHHCELVGEGFSWLDWALRYVGRTIIPAGKLLTNAVPEKLKTKVALVCSLNCGIKKTRVLFYIPVYCDVVGGLIDNFYSNSVIFLGIQHWSWVHAIDSDYVHRVAQLCDPGHLHLKFIELG